MITDLKSLQEIQHRDDLPEFLNRHGMTGSAAEIGTYEGHFAETILERWAGWRLNLVDPYRNFPPDEYVDGVTIDHTTNQPIDFEALFWRTHKKLIGFPAAYFIRQASAEAHAMFDDETMDMVYIDANHTYQHATEDIGLWWPKLKKGAIMGLHDCYTRDDGQLKCGVFDAVMDFSAIINQRPRLTYCTTAWFVKL